MRVISALALFREVTSYSGFHECDAIDLSMEQVCGQAAIHDVTCTGVRLATLSIHSAYWLLLGCHGNPGSRESTGALLHRTKQFSDGQLVTPITTLR